LQTKPQVPLLQVAVALAGTGQTVPQAPQLSTSVLVSTQVPLQQLSVPGHSPLVDPHVHCPLTQLSPGEQALPQLPQFERSLAVFTQTPPQLVSPVRQHMPLLAVWPSKQQRPLLQMPATMKLGQTLSHWPQLLASVCVLTQLPLQSV
jgi:hypothetical protein